MVCRISFRIHFPERDLPGKAVGFGRSGHGLRTMHIRMRIKLLSYPRISNKISSPKACPEAKIEVVYNWIDENKVIPITKGDNPLYEEFGLSRNKFNVVYAGNLGNAQNIDVIIDSAKELAGDNNNVEFIIFGTGGLKEQFVKKVKDYGIDNVKFFPLQPIDRVSYVYGLGDVCIVSCKPGFGGSALPARR